MKKLFIAIPVVMLMASCGGGCDNSTAEGAVDCYCDMYAEMKAADEDGDEDLMDAIEDKAEKWEDEIESHFDAGDYSGEDMDKALEGRSDGCKKGM